MPPLKKSVVGFAGHAGVGARRYYNNAEQHLAPFLKKTRDEILLISKAMLLLDVAPD